MTNKKKSISAREQLEDLLNNTALRLSEIHAALPEYTSAYLNQILRERKDLFSNAGERPHHFYTKKGQEDLAETYYDHYLPGQILRKTYECLKKDALTTEELSNTVEVPNIKITQQLTKLRKQKKINSCLIYLPELGTRKLYYVNSNLLVARVANSYYKAKSSGVRHAIMYKIPKRLQPKIKERAPDTQRANSRKIETKT